MGIELAPIDFEKKKKVKNIWYYIMALMGKTIFIRYIYTIVVEWYFNTWNSWVYKLLQLISIFGAYDFFEGKNI